MNDAPPSAAAPPGPPSGATAARLEIDVFQIAGDDMFRSRRSDGTGWDWSWAPWQRDWMDASHNQFAYRCLPLTIANQTGWWVSNPVGFAAVWTGRSEPGGVAIAFDRDEDLWRGWINDQFGMGVVTWNTPFLWRTRPAGSRLFVCGPINRFKHGIQPLAAIIESDWMTMSFTMNWRFTAPGVPVRFDAGEPLFQVIPLATNLCGDLETAAVRYRRLVDDPETFAAYTAWHDARRRFHERKAAGDVRADDWQREYFQGRDVFGRPVASGHKTKIAPPAVVSDGPRP